MARRDEGGFTLIELMVVVLIIAILIAIAIPSFLGAKSRAADRGVQSDLRNALTAAKTITPDYDGYWKTSRSACAGDADPVEITATDLRTAEGSLRFASGISAGDLNRIGIDVSAGCTLILLGKPSSSGTWFGIRGTRTGDITYCRGNAPSAITASACTQATW